MHYDVYANSGEDEKQKQAQSAARDGLPCELNYKGSIEVDAEDVSSLFSNIQLIYQLNCKFLDDLEKV